MFAKKRTDAYFLGMQELHREEARVEISVTEKPTDMYLTTEGNTI